MSQDMTSTDKTTSRLLTELSIVSNSVQNRDWSTGGLASLPKPGDFGALISSANPLANLASSGVGMLTPHVSFLGKPLEEFRGDSGAVSTPAQGMATAGADIGALADTFRQSSTTETSGWTGEAADGHRITASQFAEGITAIAEAAKTISGAIIGAGEEVVKALTEIVRLIGEAVGKMVPIMADGIARAPMTMGASIVEAIGTCVAIATEYGGKISTVMGNLLANGMNLMKLVNMVLTIVHAVAQLLQKLAKLAEGGGDTSATKGTKSKTLEGGEKTATQQGQPAGIGDSATENAATSAGTTATRSGATDSTGTTAGLPSGTNRAGAMTGAATPSSLSTPSSTVGTPFMSNPSTGSTGTVPLGGMAPMAGATSNTSRSGARPTSPLAPGKSMFAGGPKEMTAGKPVAAVAGDASPAGALTGPMAMGAGTRGHGAEDTEHQRRYQIEAEADALAADDQDVIAATGVIGDSPEPQPDSY